MSKNIDKLTDHLFRHEAGKMVSVLTRIFGTENLETAEDVVQNTFIDAINLWKLKGIPDNPSAWLFRVAKNKAIDIIRKNKHSVHYDFSDNERILLTSEYTLANTMENLWREDEVKDDMLRMMFACCHPEIAEENQITLILKTLCGFSTVEIAKAFLTSEDTISKRLYRTKEFFRQNRIRLEIPDGTELEKRISAVLNAIYLLFNEGYNSTDSPNLIRQEFIEEAILLTKLLTENRYTQVPEVFALMALICFHASRSTSRLNDEGEIILLSAQDRTQWNKELIDLGNEYLNKAAFGSKISTYHLQAAIAFEHCTALKFEDTNWNRILDLYTWLLKISPSPVTALNRVAVILQLQGPDPALKELNNISGKESLQAYYLYYSLLGEIYLRKSDLRNAALSFERALTMTRSEPEKNLLREKLQKAKDQ